MIDRKILIWLLVCAFCVACMVAIGGLTRLTNSGLSIVEWNPVMGIIFPLSEQAWLSELTKYKTSPEYQKVNYNISLDDFKNIYTLEYVHRLAGRVTGMVYLLPMIIFMLSGRIKSRQASYFFILFLILMQGFMGWYMVKSGLIERPEVSHYRLSMHLILAVIIYNLLIWKSICLGLNPPVSPLKIETNKLKIASSVSILVLYFQIFLGGLVAGLQAGKIYNSFPLMGEYFVPQDMMISFSDPVFVQFIHRLNGYFLGISVLILSFMLYRTKLPCFRIASLTTAIFLFFQIVVGICTVVLAVPIHLAVIHQLGALSLLTSLLWCYFLIKRQHQTTTSNNNKAIINQPI